MIQTILDTPVGKIGQLHVLSLSSLTGLERRMLHEILGSMVATDGEDSTLGASLANLFTSPDTLKKLLQMLSGPSFKFGKLKVSDIMSTFGDTVCKVTGMKAEDFGSLNAFFRTYAGEDSSLKHLSKLISEDPELLDIASNEFKKKVTDAQITDATAICTHCGSVNVYEGVPLLSDVFLCRECGMPIIL